MQTKIKLWVTVMFLTLAIAGSLAVFINSKTTLFKGLLPIGESANLTITPTSKEDTISVPQNELTTDAGFAAAEFNLTVKKNLSIEKILINLKGTFPIETIKSVTLEYKSSDIPPNLMSLASTNGANFLFELAPPWNIKTDPNITHTLTVKVLFNPLAALDINKTLSAVIQEITYILDGTDTTITDSFTVSGPELTIAKDTTLTITAPKQNMFEEVPLNLLTASEGYPAAKFEFNVSGNKKIEINNIKIAHQHNSSNADLIESIKLFTQSGETLNQLAADILTQTQILTQFSLSTPWVIDLQNPTQSLIVYVKLKPNVQPGILLKFGLYNISLISSDPKPLENILFPLWSSEIAIAPLPPTDILEVEKDPTAQDQNLQAGLAHTISTSTYTLTNKSSADFLNVTLFTLNKEGDFPSNKISGLKLKVGTENTNALSSCSQTNLDKGFTFICKSEPLFEIKKSPVTLFIEATILPMEEDIGKTFKFSIPENGIQLSNKNIKIEAKPQFPITGPIFTIVAKPPPAPHELTITPDLTFPAQPNVLLNLLTDPSGFPAAKFEFKADKKAEIKKIGIYTKNIIADGLDVSKIETIQLFTTDKNGQNEKPLPGTLTGISGVSNSFILKLNSLWIIEPDAPQNLLAKIQLKPDAEVNKKFALGVFGVVFDDDTEYKILDPDKTMGKEITIAPLPAPTTEVKISLADDTPLAGAQIAPGATDYITAAKFKLETPNDALIKKIELTTNQSADNNPLPFSKITSVQLIAQTPIPNAGNAEQKLGADQTFEVNGNAIFDSELSLKQAQTTYLIVKVKIAADAEINKKLAVGINLIEGTSANQITYKYSTAAGTPPLFGNALIVQIPPPPTTTLTLKKNVINNDGGTLSAANFYFEITNTSNSSKITGAKSDVAYSLPAGTYTITETLLTGYTLESFTGDCVSTGANATITLKEGQNATCTITNNDIAQTPAPGGGGLTPGPAAPPLPTIATLIIKKTVKNNNIGTLNANNFSFTITDTTNKVVKINDAKSDMAYVLAPGSYSVKEALQPGYVVESFSGNCSTKGKLTLMAGQNAICGVVNNYTAKEVKTGPGIEEEETLGFDETVETEYKYEKELKAAAPDLGTSQKIIKAPEKAQTGPGVAVYFGILAAIQSGLWLRRKLKK